MSNQKSGTTKLANRAKDVVAEDARKAQELLKDAIQSRSYLYPVKGIYYFLAHKELWKPVFSQVIPIIGTASCVTAFMFLFTYLPQAAVLALVNGPFSILSTVLLVLNESSTITNIIARGMFLEDKLLDTFDGTLLMREQSDLVSNGRELKGGRGGRGGNVMARLGKIAKSRLQLFSPNAIIRYLIYLPLNAIPIVGTFLFVILQGRDFGPLAHSRYFQLKGYDNHQKEQHIQTKRAAYTGFGVPAVLLQMVPFVGIFFAFTNTVGAALWAADMEQGKPAPQSARPEDAAVSSQQSTGIERENNRKEL